MGFQELCLCRTPKIHVSDKKDLRPKKSCLWDGIVMAESWEFRFPVDFMEHLMKIFCENLMKIGYCSD